MKGIIRGTGDKKQYLIDGRDVTEAEFFAAFPPAPDLGGNGAGLIAWKRPLRSKAMAVHPRQVQEANARNKRLGLAARYDRDGTAVIPDRSARRDLLKAEAFHDNDGGYGDG